MEPLLTDFEIGLGTMGWSHSRLLGYGNKLDLEDSRPIFQAALEAGVRFFDTAEAYGRSEKVLGKFLEQAEQKLYIATKYAPWPWRFSRQALIRALDGSLARLGLQQIDLYQIHVPTGLVSQDSLWESLAEAVETGRARQVGVSNYSAGLMRRAHAFLAKRGIPLASNQVEYSLVQRSPEVDGLLQACRELDVQLIAYSPLGRGALSGRYRPGDAPSDGRRYFSQFKEDELGRIQGLVRALGQIGEKHQKTPAQVALNWLARQPNVIPIPGANKVEYAAGSAASVGWSISNTEADQLAEAAAGFRKPAPAFFGLRA